MIALGCKTLADHHQKLLKCLRIFLCLIPCAIENVQKAFCCASSAQRAEYELNDAWFRNVAAYSGLLQIPFREISGRDC